MVSIRFLYLGLWALVVLPLALGIYHPGADLKLNSGQADTPLQAARVFSFDVANYTVTFDNDSVGAVDRLVGMVVFTAILLVLFVFMGDRSDTHRRSVAQYKSIWTTLILICSIALVINLFAFDRLNQRVPGLSAMTNLTRDSVLQLDEINKRSIKGLEEFRTFLAQPEPNPSVSEADTDARIAAESLARAQSDLLAANNTLAAAEGALGNPSVEQSQAIADRDRALAAVGEATAARDAARDVQSAAVAARLKAEALYLARIDTARIYFRNNQSDTDLAIRVVRRATDQMKVAVDSQKGDSRIKKQLVEASDVLSNAQDAYLAIAADQTNAQNVLISIEAARGPVRNFQSSVEQIRGDVVIASANTRIASEALASADRASMPMFIWIGAFYSLMVIFPWALFLLFIYRKRSDRADQIAEDLRRLDPTERLLRRARGVDGAASASAAQRNGSDVSKDLVRAELSARAFSDFEYVLILIVLTILAAIGWFFVFYPRTTSGLASIISEDGGSKELTSYLLDGLTPIMMGFVGSYFYAIQMLVRRYHSGDLYPSAFLQATIRILAVFTLTLVLSTVFATGTGETTVDGTMNRALIGAAFLAGIFPDAILQLITGFVNRSMKSRFQSGVEVAPLTALDGLSIWNQARLQEENIENVETMAMCQIDQLVLRTHFSTGQLVDWVDQAILYMHAGSGGEWFAPLRTVGVRSASDLLNVTGLDLFNAGQLRFRDFWPNRQAVGRVVAAVNAGRVEWTPAADNPVANVRAATVALHMVAVKLVDDATAISALSSTIAPGTEITFDRLLEAGTFVTGACKKTRSLAQEAEKLVAAFRPLACATPPETQQTSSQIANTCDRLETSVARLNELYDDLMTIVPTLKLAMVHHASVPTAIENVKNVLDRMADITTAIEIDVRILGSIAISPGAKPAPSDRPTPSGDRPSTPAQRGLDSTEDIQQAIDRAQEALRLTRRKASLLDVDRPETLDVREDLAARTRSIRLRIGGVSSRFEALQQAARELPSEAAATRRVNDTLQLAREDIEALGAQEHAVTLQAGEIARGGTPDLETTDTSFEQLARGARQVQYAAESIVSMLHDEHGLGLLTVEMLHVLCDAIWPDINLQYVLNFYGQIGNSLVGGDKGPDDGDEGAFVQSAGAVPS